MKAIIQLIIAILFIAITASATPYGSSTVELSIEDFGRYTMEINGNRYPVRNGVVILDNVMPGRYNVSILKHDNSNHGSQYRTRVVYQDRISGPSNSAVIARFDRRFGMRVITEPLRRNGYIAHSHHNAMHPNGHAELIHVMASTPFDNSKLAIAKAALSHNAMTSKQVRDVMRQFTFDRNKLDFAKFAFDHCVDPQNYYSLANEFTFDSYARELMRYIQ